jgi:hypothetical protein
MEAIEVLEVDETGTPPGPLYIDLNVFYLALQPRTLESSGSLGGAPFFASGGHRLAMKLSVRSF